MAIDKIGDWMIATFVRPTGGWKRQGGVLLSVIAIAGIALAEGKPETSGLSVEEIRIKARPLASFDKENVQLHRFGQLEWRGGLVLTSPSRHFGGWSGLAIDATGSKLIAVSDAGTWLTGELTYRGNKISGITSARIGPLMARGDKPLRKGRDRDAEGVALVDGSPQKGNLLISFEGNDRIGRFPIGAKGVGAPHSYMSTPNEIKKARSFDGIESVAVLRGGPRKGSIIAFAERLLAKETERAGWIWTGNGDPQRFSLTDIGGFDVTDAAGLPDGGLLVLERRFRWSEGVKMRLRYIAARDIAPGAKLSGEVLIQADLNQEIDNMEGLAVHAGPAGETILTLISDDNFNPLLQRTLLLQFALPAKNLAVR